MAYFGDNWDFADFPLAYLITIRTYGTWLHGDERTSIDTHGKQNVYGTPRVPPNLNLHTQMESNMISQAMIFDDPQRAAVSRAIENVCLHRDYNLHALSVRSNHAHAVVSANDKPELIANSFKSYSTRELRSQNLVEVDRKIWVRGRSRRYLWKANHVSAAIDYVLYCQGVVTFEDWFESKYT